MNLVHNVFSYTSASWTPAATYKSFPHSNHSKVEHIKTRHMSFPLKIRTQPIHHLKKQSNSTSCLYPAGNNEDGYHGGVRQTTLSAGASGLAGESGSTSVPTVGGGEENELTPVGITSSNAKRILEKFIFFVKWS